MTGDLSFPRSREEYDELRRKLEALGVTVKTPWREGLHSIRLGDILDERAGEAYDKGGFTDPPRLVEGLDY